MRVPRSFHVEIEVMPLFSLFARQYIPIRPHYIEILLKPSDIDLSRLKEAVMGANLGPGVILERVVQKGRGDPYLQIRVRLPLARDAIQEGMAAILSLCSEILEIPTI
jgi:hypothetical protein